VESETKPPSAATSRCWRHYSRSGQNVDRIDQLMVSSGTQASVHAPCSSDPVSRSSVDTYICANLCERICAKTPASEARVGKLLIADRRGELDVCRRRFEDAWRDDRATCSHG